MSVHANRLGPKVICPIHVGGEHVVNARTMSSKGIKQLGHKVLVVAWLALAGILG
jgi:hypothetical protein